MANSYVTKRELNNLEKKLDKKLDDGLARIENLILSMNGDSAPSENTKEAKDIEETKDSEEPKKNWKDKYGTLEERTAFVGYQKRVRAEFSKYYVDSDKTMVISPKSKYNKVVDKLADDFKKNKRFSAKACEDAWKANAKKIDKK